MADKLHGDVTRTAVELATKSVALATEKLKLIITTGPDQVMATPTQAQDLAARNPAAIPYIAQSGETVDNNLLDSMLANAQVSR